MQFDYPELFMQFPTLAICGVVAYFLFSKIEKLNDKIITITEKSVEAIANNTNALNELKEMIHTIRS